MPPEEKVKVKRLPKWSNTTDPDSRIRKESSGGRLQGYHAQATVTGEGIVFASGVVSDENDLNQLRPMLTAAKENLEAIAPRLGGRYRGP